MTRETHDDGQVVMSTSVEMGEHWTWWDGFNAQYPAGDPHQSVEPAWISITDADGRTSVTIIPLPGTNSPGVHNTSDQSYWGAIWDGFSKGLKAGWYTVVDAYTPDFAIDVSEAKAAAWKQAGLEGTWTQSLSEFSAAASREASIALATGGLGNLAKASRAAALVMVPVRTALVAREGYEAYQNTVAAYQNFKDENYWAAAGRAGLAALNLIGGVSGARQLKSDVKLAFPKTPVPSSYQPLPILNQLQCFSPDTLVATPVGPRAIGEMLEGDRALAFNFKSGQWVERPVTKRHENIYEGPVVTLTTDGGSIRTTVYHPFWVVNGQDLAERSTPRKLDAKEDQGQSLPGRWVNSHELRVGDVLFGEDGRQRIVLRIEQEYRSAFPVINLTIDEHHSFAVGADAILVHNTAVCRLEPAPIRNGRLQSQDPRLRPGYDPGAIHDDHTVAQAFGGTETRPIPAGMNLRKGGLEGELRKYEKYLVANGMDPTTARQVIASEIESLSRDVIAQPVSSVFHPGFSFDDLNQ